MSWMGSLFGRETVPLLESSLGFAHQRQLTIMNNIANVETPYYKRQSVPEDEFQESMVKAIKERREEHPKTLEMSGTSRIKFGSDNYPHARIKSGKEWGPERHDENSVVIEKEMSDLAKNTLFIQTAQNLLKKKYTMLRSSLRDRVA